MGAKAAATTMVASAAAGQQRHRHLWVTARRTEDWLSVSWASDGYTGHSGEIRPLALQQQFPPKTQPNAAGHLLSLPPSKTAVPVGRQTSRCGPRGGRHAVIEFEFTRFPMSSPPAARPDRGGA